MKYSILIWRLMMAVLAASAAADVAPAADLTADAQKDRTQAIHDLMEVLQSAAPVFDKARACQQLGEIGDKTAVPALSLLLADEHLSAYARSALEGIPDPSAAVALRAALRVLKGRRLAGVINSLAVLRDSPSIPALRRLAEDQASGVSSEALLALGRIDTAASVAIISRVLDTGAEAARADAAAACLLAAERELADGRPEAALSLNELVRNSKAPDNYRAAATRGAILAHPSDRVAFLVEQLRSEEPIIRNAALLTIREIPSPALADALNAEIDQAAPELQLQLLDALADCHNDGSLEILAAKAGAGAPKIRAAALRILSNIGDPRQAGVLLQAFVAGRRDDETELAKEGLERLQGATVDELVLKTLAGEQEDGARVRLIELLAARGATNADAELIKDAVASPETTSVAALKALGALARAGETPALIALAKSSTTAAERTAAESALCRAAVRNNETNAAGDAVLEELHRSSDPVEKNSWVRILVSLGYTQALPDLEAVMKHPNETVATNAIATLGYWPDPAPVEALLALLEANASPNARDCALNAVIQLATVAADEHQCPAPLIVAWMKRAGAAAQTVAARRRIISVLGRVNDIESLRLLLPWLDQPETQAETGIAVVQIAASLATGAEAAEVKGALEKVAATAKTDDLREQARKLAR